MINVKEITYKDYGKALEVSNGEISLVVTCDIGPRILSFKTKNNENMLFNDTQDLVHGSDEQRELYKEKMGIDEVWHLYGGHRMWISPEIIPTACYPDNHPVNYEITKNGVKLTCDIQKYTNLLFETEITMSDDNNEVEIKGTITNKGAFDAKLAPWFLTVMDKGGVEIMPLATKDTGLLPNNYLSVWSYAKLNDKRIGYFDKYITVNQDKDIKDAFKLGLRTQHGWAAYKNKGCLFVKYFDSDYENGDFPDNGVNYETYTNDEILEMESLGTTVSLKAGESVVKCEKWNLFELDKEYDVTKEDEIDAIVEKYIK